MRLDSERLDLVPQTADALDALIDGDRARLEALIRLIWGRLPLSALTDGTIRIDGDVAVAKRLAAALGNTR